MDSRDRLKIIVGQVPLAEMFGYATDVRSVSQGRATFTMHFGRYSKVPANITEEVVLRVRGKKV
jgi:elongation factor G